MRVRFLFDSSSIIPFLVSSKEIDSGVIATLDLAFYEVPNVIRKMRVNRGMKKDEAGRLLDAFTAMPFGDVYTIRQTSLTSVFDASISYSISLYGAAYIVSARELSLCLVTEDKKLAKSAGKDINVMSFEML